MPTREELPDRLTYSEVADILDLAVGTVRKLVGEGALKRPADSIVGDGYVDTDSLSEYVNRRYGGKRSGT